MRGYRPGMVPEPTSDARCPICGVGVVVDITYDVDRTTADTPATDVPMQTADSDQLTRYSCGHSVAGASLASADADRLDVEQRSSEETLAPDPG